MDLIALVLVLALIGFVVFLITERIPMPPYWKLILQLLALLVVLLFVLPLFGVTLPNVLPRR